MAHVAEAEMLEYVEGAVGESRRTEIGVHLFECAQCRAARDELCEMIDGIKARDSSSEALDLRARVRSAMLQPPRRALFSTDRRALAGLAGAIAAAVMAAVFLPAALENNEFRSKSTGASDGPSRWTGVQAFVAKGSGEVSRLGPHLGKDAVMFTYSNLGFDPYQYLMIFAVDSSSEVRWYYPAYSDANSDPGAISITAKAAGVPLPERIEHDMPKGQLIFYSIFLRRPLRVSEIEARVRKLTGEGVFTHAGNTAPKLSVAEDALEQSLVTEVQ